MNRNKQRVKESINIRMYLRELIANLKLNATQAESVRERRQK